MEKILEELDKLENKIVIKRIVDNRPEYLSADQDYSIRLFDSIDDAKWYLRQFNYSEDDIDNRFIYISGIQAYVEIQELQKHSNLMIIKDHGFNRSSEDERRVE